MSTHFHEGELNAREKAGLKKADDHDKSFARSDLPEIAKAFLEKQTMAIATTIDEQGSVWVSGYWGEAGFVTSITAQTIHMNASHGHLLESANHLNCNRNFGLLLIDFAARKRMRVNGVCNISSSGEWVITVEQVYSNCPKYIHQRNFIPMKQMDIDNQTKVVGMELLDHQKEWIQRANTFFIGSYSPEHGADASHRGGAPGFVDVCNSNKLIIPDYQGNNYFNTIGNLLLYNQCGLMFIDFEQGHTLRLSGTMNINWERNVASSYPGAKRVMEFTIQSVVEESSVMPGIYVE